MNNSFKVGDKVKIRKVSRKEYNRIVHIAGDDDVGDYDYYISKQGCDNLFNKIFIIKDLEGGLTIEDKNGEDVYYLGNYFPLIKKAFDLKDKFKYILKL